MALSHLVVQYESNFCTVALQFMEEEKNYPLPSPAATGTSGLESQRPSPDFARTVSSYGQAKAERGFLGTLLWMISNIPIVLDI